MSEKPESENKVILIVDDDARNRKVLEALLVPEGYSVQMATNGAECLEKVAETKPDLVLLDVVMPEMDGIEACRRLRENPETFDIPVVFTTALADLDSRIRGKEAGADDFLTKPIDATELMARTRNLLQVKEYHDHVKRDKELLEERVEQRTVQLREANEETLLRLSMAAEYKDDDTGVHLLRMSGYTELVARGVGFDEPRVQLLRQASVTHDIGKVGIPDSILMKPGKLDEEEWVVMRTHAEIGAHILSGSHVELLQMSERVALSHHEKWNGQGYPRSLAEGDIPIEGRIVAIADVFDALTSRRPYKEPFGIDESVDIIRQERGQHFDPAVVAAFESRLPEVTALCRQTKDIEVQVNSYVLKELDRMSRSDRD